MMTFTLLATACAAILGLGVIADSWRRHGAAILGLRDQLRACPPLREFRYTLVTMQVRMEGGTILRPDFRPAVFRLPPPARRAA